jgi:uncharacterized protein (TIGR00730 family)
MSDVNKQVIDADNLYALSKEDMQRVAIERIAEITQEFTDGFKFLENYPKSVTFFGSNQAPQDSLYCQDARKLASLIVKELDYAIVSGGGPGIMEAANQGASEAGGDSLGLIIKMPKEQVVNKHITQELSTYYFFVRKVLLSFSAEAYIFYPGGFGTLDEFFEILTLVQTKKIEGVPIICVGSDYWNKMKDLITTEILDRKYIDPEDLSLFHITDDHNEIIDIIRKVPVRTGLPFNGQVEKPAPVVEV